MTVRVRRWHWWAAATALLIVVGSAVTWLTWPDPKPVPQSHVYREVAACLLTDAPGITSEETAPVWAGISDAAKRTNGQARYLPLTTDATASDARALLGTLMAWRCDVIVASGQLAERTVAVTAPQYRDLRFIVVGQGSTSDNLIFVARTQPKETETAVSAAVEPFLAARN